MNWLLLHLDTLLLLLFGLGAVASAAAMIVLRQPMRVAIALISSMVFLGGIYGLQGVHFIAAFQVLIYVGAVMVFMVYVIMLLNVRDESGPMWSKSLLVGMVAGAALLVALLGSIWRALPMSTRDVDPARFGIVRFAREFLAEYWLHFELVSVLLLAAVVSALAIIRVSRRADGKPGHG